MSGAKSLFNNGRSELKADLAEKQAHDAAVLADRRATANKANAYERLLREQVVGAAAVFVYGFGWRVVQSVNEKTVTVFEPHAWDGRARYGFDKIVEVKS